MEKNNSSALKAEQKIRRDIRYLNMIPSSLKTEKHQEYRRITTPIPIELFNWLDEKVKKGIFGNRTEAILYYLEQAQTREKK